jgi:hypothetical protein
VAAVAASVCTRPVPPADTEGAPGYLHTAEKSRFFPDAERARLQAVDARGFATYRGADGVLVTDARTGLTFAVPSNSRDKASAAASVSDVVAPLSAAEHDRRVLDYFVQAGLPRDQVDHVHANTYLSASGPTSRATAIQPRVDGYASIVSRQVGGFLVVDSTAWARMDADGRVVGEWVYWPAIPAAAIADARRLDQGVKGQGRVAYLAKLASAQKEGRVVIRHSSPFSGGDFRAFASYDVTERVGAADRGRASFYVRHFDADGREFRLPQELRNLGKDYPAKESTPSRKERRRRRRLRPRRWSRTGVAARRRWPPARPVW